MQKADRNSKNYQLFLESQILSDYSLNRYQIRYMLQNLSEFKPHYEILRYFKSVNVPSKNVFGGAQQKPKQDGTIYLEFEIFDSIQKINKYLQIFLLDIYSAQSQLRSLKNLVERVQSFGNTNLVLMPLDSYALDSEQGASTSNVDFFVVEFETFDLTLKVYLSAFGVNEDQISPLIHLQADYCEQISLIKKLQPIRDLYDNWFVQMKNLDQIQLKINLVALNYFYKIKEDLNDEEMYSSLKQVDQSKFTTQSKLDNFDENKKNALQELTDRMKSTKFQELEQKIMSKILGEELIQRLLEQKPNVFELHDITIFKIIAESQKYQYFEIIDIEKDRFLFKIYKMDGSISYLEGKKCSSLEQAKELESQYKNLISATLKNQPITTITSSELIQTQSIYYILLERKFRVSNLQNQNENLFYFLQDEKFRSIQKEENLLNILSDLVQLCYTLVKNHSVQITTVNPSLIFVSSQIQHASQVPLDQQGSQEQPNVEIDRVVNFQVEDFNQGGYCCQHLKVFQNLVVRFRQAKDIQVQTQKLFTCFLGAISQRNFDQLEKVYQQIQTFINQLRKIMDLEQEIAQKLIGFEVLLSFADPLLENLNIMINNLVFSPTSIKTFCNLMNAHSLNKVQWNRANLSQANLLKYQRNRNNKMRMRQEQIATLHQFFSMNNAQEQSEFIITSSLQSLMMQYDIDLDVSVEKNSFNFGDGCPKESDPEEQKLINYAKEQFSQKEFYLKLNFFSHNNKNENTVISILFSNDSAVVVLCESPLKLQYLLNNCSFEEHLIQAQWYQSLKILLPENLVFPKCSSFDIAYLQLSVVYNLNTIRELELSMKFKDYAHYRDYGALLVKHEQLQQLNISPYHDDLSDLSHKQKLNLIFSELKQIVTQMKNLNSLKLEVLSSENLLTRKCLQQLHKSTRLVNIIPMFLKTSGFFSQNIQPNQRGVGNLAGSIAKPFKQGGGGGSFGSFASKGGEQGSVGYKGGFFG